MPTVRWRRVAPRCASAIPERLLRDGRSLRGVGRIVRVNEVVRPSRKRAALVGLPRCRLPAASAILAHISSTSDRGRRAATTIPCERVETYGHDIRLRRQRDVLVVEDGMDLELAAESLHVALEGREADVKLLLDACNVWA